jgi:hypothetical protein
VSATKETFLSRNAWVAYERTTIIGSNAKGIQASAKARKKNQDIDRMLEEQREEWVLIPPSNMTVTLHKDAGAIPSGLVLSVPHEIGRVILHKRMGRIIEHEVTVDAR